MMNLPGGCEVRCPTINDSVAVLALIQEKEWAEYGKVSTTKRSLRNAWQALSFNLSTDAWVVTAQGGQIIGYARVWHYQHLYIYLQLVVLPASNEVEIKIFLLSMAEQRAGMQITQLSHQYEKELQPGNISRNDLVAQ